MRLVTPALANGVAQNIALSLAQMLKPDGSFIYRYLWPDPTTADNHYNNIRHIASVWFLLEAERAVGPVSGVQEAAVKSGEFMIEHFIAPYGGSGHMLCVLDEGYVKLGGAGLAVNVLCGLWDLTSQDRYLDLAERIVAYILTQRLSDGEFIHMRPYPAGPPHPARSKFFTGQALMGLLQYWRRSDEAEILEAVQGSVTRLGLQDTGVKTQSHWMVYALQHAYETQPSDATRSYAGRIAHAIMGDKGYRTSGLLSAIACRTEALLAYDRLLESAGCTSMQDPRMALLQHIRQNLSLLLKFKADRGIFIQSKAHPEVRIDNLGHAGSCFLGYAQLASS